MSESSLLALELRLRSLLPQAVPNAYVHGWAEEIRAAIRLMPGEPEAAEDMVYSLVHMGIMMGGGHDPGVPW